MKQPDDDPEVDANSATDAPLPDPALCDHDPRNGSPRGLETLVQGAAPKMIRISGKRWLTREEWKRSVGEIWRGGIPEDAE